MHFSQDREFFLCASKFAETFDQVHLAYCDSEAPVDISLLEKRYGAKRFHLVPYSHETLHDLVCFHDYQRLRTSFGTLVVALRFSSLSRHGAVCELARSLGISLVADPQVNPHSAHSKLVNALLKRFYASFDPEHPIDLIHPNDALGPILEQHFVDYSIPILPPQTKSWVETAYLNELETSLLNPECLLKLERLYKDRLAALHQHLSLNLGSHPCH